MHLKPTSKMLLSVDWDPHRLRLVHAAVKKGRVDIRDMLSVDVPPDVDLASPEAVGALLRSALDQLGIRTRRVILDVPRDQALLTTLNLPAASLDEMPALVEFQIAKELPFGMAEAVVDFAMPVIQSNDVKVDVLVGTVRREVVRYYERACQAAGLNLERLGLRPYANLVAISELLGPDRPGCVMLVDVGPRLTEIDVISDGHLAFSRAASVAVGPVTPLGAGAAEAEAPDAEREASSIIRFPRASDAGSDPVDRVVEGLLVEVTRSFEAFRAQSPDRTLGAIVVAGDVGVEARLAEALSRRMRTTVELYNPARRFGWPDERGREARAFSATLGLICGHADPGRLHFDFLHPKKPVTTVERRLRKAPAVAAVVALFAVAAASFYLGLIAPRKRQIAEVEEQIGKVKKTLEDLQRYQERVIEPIEEFEAEQLIWVDELNRLAGMLPGNEDAVLTRLDMYQKDARINIPLNCRRAEVALEAVSRIDAFRLPGNDAQYFDATARTFTTKGTGQYPSSGSIDVEVKGVGGAARE